MVQDLMTPPTDMLTRLGRNWGWLLAYGIITLIGGIFVLAWPGPTVVVLAVLFGIQLIVVGIFRFVAAFAVADTTGGTRALLALLGVLSFIGGCTRCSLASSGSSTAPWRSSPRSRTVRCRAVAGSL